jgi:FkbM family methyltransferase
MNIFYNIKLYLHLLRYRGLREKLQYSRWGEDSFLINYFKDTSNGRYIDIGAFHPFRGSNTYLLYKKGWSGINIDLNKTSIDLFKLARPNDINLNLAISDANKKIKVYQTKDLGKMNTIDPKFASIFLKNYHVRESCSYNLNDILYKYNASKNNRFELIDIDVEGSEYQILENLNFNKYSFKLILVETHIGNLHFKQQSDKIHTLLKSKNYNYLKKFGETAVYENAEG